MKNNNELDATLYQMSEQTKKNKRIDYVKGILLTVVVCAFIGVSIKNVAASELKQSTISYGNKVNAIDDTTRKNVIKSQHQNPIHDQLIGKGLSKQRTGVILDKQKKYSESLLNSEKSSNVTGMSKISSPLSQRYYTPEFSIYDAVSYLENDYDGDGYFQTFSVVFDADVYNPNGNNNSVIYAELYISTDGENWQHYYTTDDFLIQGSGDQDKYEVITTFAEGYHPDQYDVLIDIYEVGYADVVATYSSYDNSSLYALPLESSDYDKVYVEEVVVHGGTQSIPYIIGLLTLVMIRYFSKYNKK